MTCHFHVAALLSALLMAPISRAASVSVSLVAEVGTPVPAGSTLPYEIHITISDAGGSSKTQGLCMFVVHLQSDPGVEQAPIQAFAPEITAGFDDIGLQFGVPDGSGAVSGIAAAQPCIVAEDTVLGLGLHGQTLVAQGELFMPPTSGEFNVQIIPAQILLIGPEGDGAITPESASGGSLSVTVGPAGPGDDGDTDTDGLGGDDGDAGTNGLGDGDSGTDGLGNGEVGTNGGPDGGDGDAGTDGLDDGDDNSNSSAGSDLGMVGGGSDTPGSPTLGLCGAGLLGSILTGLIAANAFRASGARPRPRPRTRRRLAFEPTPIKAAGHHDPVRKSRTRSQDRPPLMAQVPRPGLGYTPIRRRCDRADIQASRISGNPTKARPLKIPQPPPPPP